MEGKQNTNQMQLYRNIESAIVEKTYIDISLKQWEELLIGSNKNKEKKTEKQTPDARLCKCSKDWAWILGKPMAIRRCKPIFSMYVAYFLADTVPWPLGDGRLLLLWAKVPWNIEKSSLVSSYYSHFHTQNKSTQLSSASNEGAQFVHLKIRQKIETTA